MKKIAIFNVWWAFSAYIQIDDVKIIYDLWAWNNFSPTIDFLLPLAKLKWFEKIPTYWDKYKITQLFLSHLDNDHISDYNNFNEYFCPSYMTVPNDNVNQNPSHKIDRERLSDNETAKNILDKMKLLKPWYWEHDLNWYEVPLISCLPDKVFLNYIKPSNCEILDQISDSKYSNYSNNLSLVVYIILWNNSSILFTWDIMPDWLSYLIDKNKNFKELLNNYWVDYYIAPHHWLDTSFSDYFYSNIKNNKVWINIISEKKIIKSDTDNRHNVDCRYYDSNFSNWKNVINWKTWIQYWIITSLWHIVIDFESDIPTIKRCYTNDDLLKEFI